MNRNHWRNRQSDLEQLRAFRNALKANREEASDDFAQSEISSEIASLLKSKESSESKQQGWFDELIGLFQQTHRVGSKRHHSQ